MGEGQIPTRDACCPAPRGLTPPHPPPGLSAPPPPAITLYLLGTCRYVFISRDYTKIADTGMRRSGTYAFKTFRYNWEYTRNYTFVSTCMYIGDSWPVCMTGQWADWVRAVLKKREYIDQAAVKCAGRFVGRRAGGGERYGGRTR